MNFIAIIIAPAFQICSCNSKIHLNTCLSRMHMLFFQMSNNFHLLVALELHLPFLNQRQISLNYSSRMISITMNNLMNYGPISETKLLRRCLTIGRSWVMSWDRSREDTDSSSRFSWRRFGLISLSHMVLSKKKESRSRVTQRKRRRRIRTRMVKQRTSSTIWRISALHSFCMKIKIIENYLDHDK